MVDISFPTKGWNTNCPRNEQPDATSADLLNVLPFDRDYRARGSVRPGTGKFVGFTLGGGASVLLTKQVTVALDPASIQPANLLLSEPFIYPDGTAVNAIDTMPADSSPDWHVAGGAVNGSIIPLTFSTTGNFLTVNTLSTSSSTTYVHDTSGANAYHTAVYKGSTLVTSSSFVIKAVINMETTSHDVAIMFGVDQSAYTDKNGAAITINQNGFGYYIQKAGGSVFSSGTGTWISTSISTGSDHSIEVHVNGLSVSVFLDGTLAGSVSVPSGQFPTGSGIGFGFANGASSQAQVYVRNFQVYSGQPLASYRKTELVVVAGGNIYSGDNILMNLAANGTGVLSSTLKPQMASAAGFCYFVDGTHDLQVLELDTNTVTTIATTSGLETATTLGAYSLACTWRDRLVLAASVAFPMNFIMSRQGDPTDWDYSALDAAAAVAGNASRAGSIGEPLNCLIPWTDDVLILGGDHSIYKVEGDIAAGGQILVVSEAIGTLGADSWALDPVGNLYFVGTDGLYRMAAGGLPQNISDSVRDFFVSINRTTTYVMLNWDRDRNGLWIHMTPVNTGAATHLFWDAGLGAFFPIQYPNSTGPMSSTVFDGDGPLDRQLILGGRDGYIRKINPLLLKDDNGTGSSDIASHVLIGPYRPAGDAALSVLEALEVVLGDAPGGFSESDFGVGLTILAAKDAFTLVTSPQTEVFFNFTKQARRKRLLQRISGGSFMFELYGLSGKLWSFEKMVALFTQGGLQRRY